MTDDLAARCARAVHVLPPDGRMLRAGRASLYVLAVLGWPRVAAMLSLRPFVWTVEGGYWLVARHRAWLSRLVFRRR